MIEINGQQLFCTEDIAKMKNYSGESIRKVLHRHNLTPVYYEKIVNHKIGYYTKEQVDLIPYLDYRGKTQQKNFYRISQYDETTGVWVVVACGLGRERAKQRVKQLKEQGYCAVATDHRLRFKEPKAR